MICCRWMMLLEVDGGGGDGKGNEKKNVINLIE